MDVKLPGNKSIDNQAENKVNSTSQSRGLSYAIYGTTRPTKTDIKPVRNFKATNDNLQTQKQNGKTDVSSQVCSKQQNLDHPEVPSRNGIQTGNPSNSIIRKQRPKSACLSTRSSTMKGSYLSQKNRTVRYTYTHGANVKKTRSNNSRVRQRNTSPKFSDANKIMSHNIRRPHGEPKGVSRTRKRRPKSAVEREGRVKSENAIIGQENASVDLESSRKTIRRLKVSLDNVLGKVKMSQLSEGEDMTTPVKVSLLQEIALAMEAADKLSRAYELKQCMAQKAETRALDLVLSQLQALTDGTNQCFSSDSNVTQKQSNNQAKLWLKQANVLQEIIKVEKGNELNPKKVSSLDSTKNTESILPSIFVQALAVATGIARSFSQACLEGREEARNTIQEIYANLERKESVEVVDR